MRVTIHRVVSWLAVSLVLALVSAALVQVPGPVPVARAATTVTYSSGPIAVVFSDGFPAHHTITVPDNVTIVDLNVKIRISHTFDSDVRLLLTSPDNTVVELANEVGDNDDDFGSGSANCNGTFTTFDEASTSIVAGSAPFAGSYRPSKPLSVMDGKNAEGAWKLSMFDGFAGDDGIVHCWQLEVTAPSAPTADDDIAVTTEGTPVDIPVLANDSDSDGTLDPSTVTVTSGPTNGSTSVNTTTGVITYAPGGGFTGPDVFTYTVQDNHGATSNEATVSITVNVPTPTFIPTAAATATATETATATATPTITPTYLLTYT